MPHKVIFFHKIIFKTWVISSLQTLAVLVERELRRKEAEKLAAEEAKIEEAETKRRKMRQSNLQNINWYGLLSCLQEGRGRGQRD